MDIRIEQPDIERYIDEQVKAGNFSSAEAVVRDAMARMMEEEHDALTTEDWEAIQESRRQLDRGEGIEFSEVQKQMRQQFNF
jgi:putative addiction module CopG family antidote